MSRWLLNLLALNLIFTFFTFVLASNIFADLLGLGAGTAHNDEPFRMEKIKHQGILSPFNLHATDYKVFKNAKVGYGIFCAFNAVFNSLIRIMAQLVSSE